jgi:hypothetical protein
MKLSHRDEIEWRQDQIERLLAKGHYSHRQIATSPKTRKELDIPDQQPQKPYTKRRAANVQYVATW